MIQCPGQLRFRATSDCTFVLWDAFYAVDYPTTALVTMKQRLNLTSFCRLKTLRDSCSTDGRVTVHRT